ncbi:sensor histidine kinase [Chakrabartyella piscis]|uniref:sensor histidine kinase n=1 Tax=Chakrabartyella piscis TaxID=2918914 RepID=UPI0029587228|nr:ATP-binding protein [Chakrabartyella piscis]
MSKKTKNKKKEPFFGKMRHMAIARKITLLYSGIFTMSLLAISAFLAFNFTVLQQQEARQHLMSNVMEIESFLQRNGGIDTHTLRSIIQDDSSEARVYNITSGELYCTYAEDDAEIFLEDAKNRLKERLEYASEGDGDIELFRQEGLEIEARRVVHEIGMEYILHNEANEEIMLMAKEVVLEDEVYLVETFEVLQMNSGLFQEFIWKLALCDLVGILCSILIAKYISRRILQPVDAIREAAERITIEDLSQRIDISGPDDEMKELSITFNSMINRLEKSFVRQNQFISDASHELRTPISVIQGYANLINRWGKSDPEVLQESIDSILSETEHMSSLIGKLLFLAKGEQNKVLVQKQVMSLTEIVEDLEKEMEVLETKRNLHLEKEQDVQIYADPDLIKQLLWIYLENAMKYTKENGNITLRVWKERGFAFVSVTDDGAGIAEAELDKIFDRFYRVDQSRNKEISGTGLGLSIAKWIVDSLGGEVSVESEVGISTTFTTKFVIYHEK